ncbi:MaoC family dehydratase [Rhodoligotrophos defluvii]|uniref:MaoC family dehydratase n=1 Tax=Rhodoligotrophos defluvii TaxID=2561934 RepID=UPI0010C97F7F|nr:MaoC family dehydratase [Rhodoligotrophos defluvii]
MTAPASPAQDRSHPLYLEDFAVGDRIRAGRFTIAPALAHDFAALYDPQPMHLDETAARASLFGELVGSGWQTLAVTMRLMVDARLLGTTPIIGAEFRELRFHRPMRPGDTLTAEAEVLAARGSRSKPELGFLDLRVRTFNQDGAELLTQTWTLVVPSRSAASTPPS